MYNSTAQHSKTQHTDSKTQHSTAQDRTAQDSTVQHSAAQHRTTEYSTTAARYNTAAALHSTASTVQHMCLSSATVWVRVSPQKDLLVTDVSTPWVVVIFKDKWRVFVRWMVQSQSRQRTDTPRFKPFTYSTHYCMYNTVKDNIAQYSITVKAKHSTIQYNRTQHNIAQYSTVILTVTTHPFVSSAW